jgi:hypothetical protein
MRLRGVNVCMYVCMFTPYYISQAKYDVSALTTDKKCILLLLNAPRYPREHSCITLSPDVFHLFFG